MTTQQAINILRQYNQRRRGDDSVPVRHPEIVSEAIEVSIGVMEMVLSGVDKPLDKNQLYDL